MCPLFRHLERPSRTLFHCLVAICLLASGLAGHPDRAGAIETDWIMDQDPPIPYPAIEVRFPPGLVDLWHRALERPEREFQRRTASTIALAHQKGLTGLEVTIDPLMKLARQPDLGRATRLTVARALIVLDARQAARLLFDNLDENDLDFAELVEPALARWDYAPMREIWLKRLASDVRLRRMHILAIRGLARLNEKKSLPRLLELASGRDIPATVRLEAATTLGRMRTAGLVKPARLLARDTSREAVVGRLVAATMLRGHRGAEAANLLVQLAADPQPAIQAMALEQLLLIDSELAMPGIDQTIASPDTKVRRLGARVLIARPTVEKLTLLGPMINDRDPELRRFVSDALVRLATDGALRDKVVALGRQALDSDHWRGREQAIEVLVSLDDKTIVDQLLELLDADRPEVHTTAAWGLCKLNVAATAEPIFAVFREKTEGWLAGRPRKEHTYAQLAHLAQAIGTMKYMPADAVLRKYVPKGTVLHRTTRSAAIWALGHLHAGKPDDPLAAQLTQRLMDIRSMEPEDDHVRIMAAVTLGRMKAEKHLGELRSMGRFEGLQTGPGYACAWAIEQLTGEAIPEIGSKIVWEIDWFLTPSGGR